MMTPYQAVKSLTPLQAAVLKVMVIEGRSYAPFEAQTQPKHAAMLIRDSMLSEDARQAVSAEAIQQALTELQDKGLIRRSAQGIFTMIDMEGTVALMIKQAGTDNPSTEAPALPEKIVSEQQYDELVTLLDRLLAEVKDDEDHPQYEQLQRVSSLIEAWDESLPRLPEEQVSDNGPGR
jgi:hypothetical protein